MKPDRRDLLIVSNNYPYLDIMKGKRNGKVKVKTIYYPCDSCRPSSFLIFEGYK